MALIAGGAAAGIAALYGMRRYCAGGVNPFLTEDLSGKNVIVTGANTGIGFETAQELARQGGNVVLACRDLERANEARDKMISTLRESKHHAGPTRNPNNVADRLHVMHLDLSDLESVREFARKFQQRFDNLDLLINNAGVMMPLKRLETKSKCELQFGVNHIGHYTLTRYLLPILKRSAPSRVVTVSSMAHNRGAIRFDDLNWTESGAYTPAASYAQSKLANILFTRQLAQHLKGTGVVATCLHPGVIRTELMRHLNKAWYVKLAQAAFYPLFQLTFKNPWEGAQTTLYCALSPECGTEAANGQYFADCKPRQSPNPIAFDDSAARRLMDESAKLAGFDKPGFD